MVVLGEDWWWCWGRIDGGVGGGLMVVLGEDWWWCWGRIDGGVG